MTYQQPVQSLIRIVVVSSIATLAFKDVKMDFLQIAARCCPIEMETMLRTSREPLNCSADLEELVIMSDCLQKQMFGVWSLKLAKIKDVECCQVFSREEKDADEICFATCVRALRTPSIRSVDTLKSIKHCRPDNQDYAEVLETLQQMYSSGRREGEHLNQSGQPYYNQGYPAAMSGPYGQPGYNPQYQNPYPAGGPPPTGWSAQGQQQGFVPPPMPHPNMMGMGGNPHYAEGGEADKYNMQFSDRTIRAAFVRKVFFLVAIMLGVVAVMTAIPFLNHDTKLFVARNMGMYWAAYGVFFAVYLALMCCESVRRSFPANIIMTAIFTLAVGYMTMMITVHHNVVSVLLTLIICTICCGSIIIFSTQTKYDLTNMMGIMFILSMCLLVFGMVAMISAIFFHVRFIYMVYAALASLLFMFYLAIDVQMLMGGRKYEISPEDHIFAAVQIFLDIVYIFWMLLSLFGSSNN